MSLRTRVVVFMTEDRELWQALLPSSHRYPGVLKKQKWNTLARGLGAYPSGDGRVQGHYRRGPCSFVTSRCPH